MKYQGQEIVLQIPDGNTLDGKLRNDKLKLVLAWIENHKDELMADWELASNGEKLFQIDPLR
jgi:hypothetical protein